jgi:glucosamine-phosphate N-acetyltransferase
MSSTPIVIVDKEKLTLRKITNNDYDQFLVLINAFRKTTFTKQEYINILKNMNKNTELWVVEYEKQLIGCGTLLIEQKFIHNLAKLGHIEDITIKKEFRKQGLGHILIEKLIERARESGCYKVTLNCTEDVSAFYESCGLEKAGIQMIERFDI